jgi:hypothetical protein
MKKKLYLLNASLLFAGASIYCGTGWSTAIFQFPVMPQLTPDNYYLHFIPQIDAATNFFTFLVTMMLVTGGIMILVEWKGKTRYRGIPIAMVLLVIGATCLTVFVIFPVNQILRDGITDQAQLMDIVAQWIFLTKVRVALWSLEWTLMMYYFATNLYDHIKQP